MGDVQRFLVFDILRGPEVFGVQQPRVHGIRLVEALAEVELQAARAEDNLLIEAASADVVGYGKYRIGLAPHHVGSRKHTCYPTRRRTNVRSVNALTQPSYRHFPDRKLVRPRLCALRGSRGLTGDSAF